MIKVWIIVYVVLNEMKERIWYIENTINLKENEEDDKGRQNKQEIN